MERVSSHSANESMGPSSSLRILGVVVNDKLTAADHVTSLLSSSSSLLLALFTTYSPPQLFPGSSTRRQLWSRMCSAADRARLDSLFATRQTVPLLQCAATTFRPSLTFLTWGQKNYYQGRVELLAYLCC